MKVKELIVLLMRFESNADAVVAFCNGTACEIADVVEVRDNHGRAQLCAEDWDKKLTAQSNSVPVRDP